MPAHLDIAASKAAADTAYMTYAEGLYNRDLPGIYKAYSEVIPTSSRTMSLHWLGQLPVMRKWVGARVERYIRAYNATTSMDPYEVTLPFQRLDMVYDNLGLISRTMQKFLSRNQYVYDKFAFAKLIANPTCYDSVALFAANHPYATSAGGTQGNLSTNPLTMSAFEAARLAMRSYTTEDDEVMGIAPTALVCGPTLERKAREILQADTRVIATDSTGKEATTMVVDTTTIQNIWQGELKLIIDERLSGTYAYYWYLLDENAAKMAAPIIIQENRKPEPHILNKNDMDGETRFWTDRFIYSLEGDFGFDAGAWQPIYGNLATS